MAQLNSCCLTGTCLPVSSATCVCQFSHLSVCLSVLLSLLLPWATTMSRSPSGSSVDDKTLLLEYRCHPARSEPSSPTCVPGKRSSTTAPGATPLSPLASPTSAEPRRIILSTESPAALKVGTQQLIPKSLAVSSKPKNSASRPQSFGASREPLSPDPKGVAVPMLALEAEDEDDGGGALKRNLRNMSYRAAMKGPGADLEPAKATSSLKPMSEDGSALPSRSPGRSKVGLAAAVSSVRLARGAAFLVVTVGPRLRSVLELVWCLGKLRVTSRCCRSLGIADIVVGSGAGLGRSLCDVCRVGLAGRAAPVVHKHG